MRKQGYTRRHMLGFAASAAAMLMAGCGPSMEAAPAAKREAPLGAMPPLFDDLQRRTFDFFWDTAQPAQRARAATAGRRPSLRQHRRGRLRAHRLPDRRRARLRHRATRRASARSPRCASSRNAPQGAAPRGHDRPQGLLLPLPRHGDRRARFEQTSSCPPSTPRCCSAGVLLRAVLLRRRRPGRGRDPRAGRSRSTRASTGAGRRRAPPLIAHRLEPGEGLPARTTGAATTRRCWSYMLALGSPTHPVEPERVERLVRRLPRRLGPLHGQEHVGFAPLFGHQYSHVWIDFRGIQDAYMRAARHRLLRELRRATLAQRAYAIANPTGWHGYGADIWGLTACDGPGKLRDARPRRPARTFHDYSARGAGARTRSTTARSRRPRRCRRCRSRPRS